MNAAHRDCKISSALNPKKLVKSQAPPRVLYLWIPPTATILVRAEAASGDDPGKIFISKLSAAAGPE